MEFEGADVTLIVKNKEYKVHKIMLKRANYFVNMFKNSFEESKKDVIELDLKFDIIYWEKFITSLYNYEIIDLIHNYDEQYFQFCQYFGLKKELNFFHEKLKQYLNPEIYFSNGWSFGDNMEEQ